MANKLFQTHSNRLTGLLWVSFEVKITKHISKHLPIYTLQIQNKISIYMIVYGHLIMFIVILALFCSPPISERTVCGFSYYKLGYILHLVANFVFHLMLGRCYCLYRTMFNKVYQSNFVG